MYTKKTNTQIEISFFFVVFGLGILCGLQIIALVNKTLHILEEHVYAFLDFFLELLNNFFLKKKGLRGASPV